MQVWSGILGSLLKCGVSYLHWIQSSTAQWVRASRAPPLQRKVTVWLYCPSGKDTTVYKHTLTSGCYNWGHGFFIYRCTCMYVHRCAINRFVCVTVWWLITSGVSVFVSLWGSDKTLQWLKSAILKAQQIAGISGVRWHHYKGIAPPSGIKA